MELNRGQFKGKKMFLIIVFGVLVNAQHITHLSEPALVIEDGKCYMNFISGEKLLFDASCEELGKEVLRVTDG